MTPYHPQYRRYRSECASLRCFLHALAWVGIAAVWLFVWDSMANRHDDSHRIRAEAHEAAKQIREVVP